MASYLNISVFKYLIVLGHIFVFLHSTLWRKVEAVFTFIFQIVILSGSLAMGVYLLKLFALPLKSTEEA